MDNISILAACIAVKEGDSVATQFRDFASGDENFEDQNISAMKISLRVLQHVARGNNDMALVAQEWVDRLNEELAQVEISRLKNLYAEQED